MTASSHRPIRVLIVDDSMFMRSAIERVLGYIGGFEVVGQARDGAEAVDKVVALGPDVVTMDYNMPRMNGAAAVREIMKQRPTPVLMFSAHTRQGARETFEALAAGAVDVCTKPDGEVSADLTPIAEMLASKLRAAAQSQPRALAPLRSHKDPTAAGRITLPPTGPRVVIIGISTGGPSALSRVIPALSANTRFAVLVVQHMPAQFTAALAERLDTISAVSVAEAQDGDRLLPGSVLIAPGDRHTELDEKGRVVLTDGPPVNGCRPSVDVTMQAAAAVYGRRSIGVIMTGMGRDGAAGMAAIKKVEGRTLAQDPESCVIPGMPRAAIEAGVVDYIVPLDEIANRLRFL